MAGERISANVQDAVTGLNELERKLQRRGIRQSLRTSAKPTLGVAKSTAPVFSGLTQRSIKLRSAGVKRGTYRMVVGVGKKWFTGPTFFAAFVAFGHRIGKRELGGIRRLVNPNDWITKAYQSTAKAAVDIFRDAIMAFIEGNGK